MSTKDVIKSSIYNSLGGGTGLPAQDIFFVLMAACLIGLYIYTVYKLTSKTAFYSKDLNMTIAGIPIIVASIMIAMQSNLIVSLGMVGALSIVRFRNAVKNPLDLLYLFWTISAGIICGVGLTVLAFSLCIIMTVLMLFLEMLPNAKAPVVLVIRTESNKIEWNEVKDIIKRNSKYSKEKSRIIKQQEVEIIFEIRSTKIEELIKELEQLSEIKQINCLSHDGECRI